MVIVIYVKTELALDDRQPPLLAKVQPGLVYANIMNKAKMMRIREGEDIMSSNEIV